MGNFDGHSTFGHLRFEPIGKSVDENPDLLLVLVGFSFVRKHPRVWRDIKIWVTPVFHVLDFFDCDVIWKLLFFEGRSKLAGRSGEGNGARRSTVEAPHRHAIVTALVPAVDEYSFSQAPPKLLVCELNLVDLVRP